MGMKRDKEVRKGENGRSADLAVFPSRSAVLVRSAMPWTKQPEVLQLSPTNSVVLGAKSIAGEKGSP